MHIEVRTSSAVPVERVFALYVDPARVPEWRQTIRRIDAEGPIERRGTRFTTHYRRVRPPSRGAVAEAEPPHRHVLGGNGLVPYRATLRLYPTARGTRIEFVLDVRLPRFLRRQLERNVRAEIERLASLAAQ